MAGDYFLKLEGIKGESADKKYKGEIDVESFSWGMTQSGTTHTASGSGSAKVSVGDLSITKHVDKSSPTLVQYCTLGKHISKGQLIVRKAGGDSQVEYLKIEMKDIMISSYQTGGAGANERISESLSLNFGEYKIVYTEQKADGSAGAAPEFGYNIAKNEKA